MAGTRTKGGARKATVDSHEFGPITCFRVTTRAADLATRLLWFHFHHMGPGWFSGSRGYQTLKLHGPPDRLSDLDMGRFEVI